MITEDQWKELVIVRLEKQFMYGEDDAKFAMFFPQNKQRPKILYVNDGVLDRLRYYIETEGYGE